MSVPEDVLRLRFEEQIAFFLGKMNVPTERWNDLVAEMHDNAFTVAGAMQADMLADLREAIDSAILEGTSIEQFRKSFDTIVSQYGWSYTGERDWRSRIIYNTNLSVSYAAGRYSQLTDPDLIRIKPFWMYLHADGVVNPRYDHVAWSHTVLPYDDPWWNTHFPPNGFNCHCRIVAVSEKEGRERGGSFRTPIGGTVDPGWGYIPGKGQAQRNHDMLKEKESRLRGGS